MKTQDMNNEQLCALAQAGDADALNQLVENNLPFINSTAESLWNLRSDMSRFWGLMPDDLAQEGSMALVKCVEHFNPGLGNKFLTYAAPAIRNAMLDVIRKQEICYTEADLNDTVSQTEIAEREAQGLSSDAYFKTPEQVYIKQESMEELHHALAQIRDREREYLYFRFGFDEEDVERTRKDTAEHFHITEASAKRTEKTALDNVWLGLPWWFHS